MKKYFSLAILVMMIWAGVAFAQDAVVRTMGQATLRPLPATPQGKLTMIPAKGRLLNKQVKRVAQDYKMPAQIYGLMVYSSTWPGGKGNGRFGVYSFAADAPNNMSAVMKSDNMAASGGAIYGKGRLNILNYEALWGSIILNYDYFEYSTQYWDLLQHVHQDDVTRLMSAAGVYDPTTDQYFAIMYTDDMQHQVFGTLNYENNSRQVIRQLADNQNVCAMAVANDGTLYAIRFDGKLVTVNKSNGQQTIVGATGITPQYLQSAAIDPRTDRMFWAACSAEDPIGLYEVNLETGEAQLIQEFKNSEELVGLYIPMPDVAEDAPAQPTSMTATFINDQLTGTVNFRLPKKTYAGEDISGTTLDFHVYVDGELAAQGTGVAGEVVRPEVTVAQSKMYRFEACAVNGVGEGQRIHLDKFVGKDQPQSPTSVKLVKTTNVDEVKLTWVAPSSQGVHKGYVDKSQLNYTVVRMPDDVVVAEKTTELQLIETLQSEQLRNYYYVVTAFNGDIEGLSAESNRITMGSVVEPPYYENFEDLTVVPNMYTFIDANKDGNTWRSGFWNGTQNSDIFYQYNEDGVTPADDWAVMPPVHLKANRFYRLSFDLNGYFIGTEKVSAWMGDDKTAAAMTTQLLPTQVVDYTDQRNMSCLVKSDTEGNRFFGFHAESDADQGVLELDNIRVEEIGVFEAPDTVTNFTVEPGNYGATLAQITFKAPVHDFLGQEITEIDRIEVYRGDQLTQLIEHPEPGSEHSFKETKLPTGNVTWTVYTYNSFGCGIPAQRTVWIGTDIPTEPTNLQLTMNGTTARLTWTAPTTGVHGGYVRASQLTYNIEDMNFYIKADHRSGTTYSENRGAKQEFLSYRVSAQSTAGGGNYATSNTVISGLAYQLPFHESFSDASTSQLWSQQNSGGQIGLTSSISADNDRGAALFKPDGNGDVGMVTSGKIDMSKAQHPILEFYYYAVPGQATTLTVAAVPDGDAENLQALKTINYTQLQGSEGWRKVTVGLDNQTSSKHILLSFIGQATGARHGDIAFDAITVREQDDVDLAVEVVRAPSVVEAGNTAKTTVKVYNNGRLAATDYQVRLCKNGKLIEEKNGLLLQSGATVNYTFDIPTTVVDQEENTIEASVVVNGDANAGNDVCSATIVLDMPLFPVPTALEGTEIDGDLNIAWTAPDLSPRNIMASESFERYQPFIIDGMGAWTLLDEDNLPTLAMQTGDGSTIMYEHVGDPMAFQVFNAEKLGLENVAALQSHSGSQMLINMLEANSAKADDWLISSELPGSEQTVSFWVKSMNSQSLENFTVMASATDAQPSSFKPIEASATQAPIEWTQVTAPLPAGTKYFAIRVNNKQKFMLQLDDVEYARYNTADLKLIGYNVYWAGEKQNEEPLKSTSYQVTWLGDTDYLVTAVYEQGESGPSQPISINSGINSQRVGMQGIDAPVYDLQGRRTPGQGLHPGVYIRNGQKIVVK